MDLDRVMVTPAVMAGWHVMSAEFAQLLAAKTRATGTHYHVPEEQCRINPDGTLTIFVDVAEAKMDVEMTVPAGQWSLVAR